MHSIIKVLTTIIFSFVLSLLFANNVFATEITEDEILFLQRLVFAESGIESEEGQVAVAANILSRVESPKFPNTIKEVAYQKGQYSSVKEGIIYEGNKVVTQEMIPEKTIRAVKRALSGENPTEKALLQEAKRMGLDPEIYASGGALYFYNPDISSESALRDRSKIKLKIRIGHHVFYKQWDI